MIAKFYYFCYLLALLDQMTMMMIHNQCWLLFSSSQFSLFYFSTSSTTRDVCFLHHNNQLPRWFFFFFLFFFVDLAPPIPSRYFVCQCLNLSIGAPLSIYLPVLASSFPSISLKIICCYVLFVKFSSFILISLSLFTLFIIRSEL